jgi:hypothetical protein
MLNLSANFNSIDRGLTPVQMLTFLSSLPDAMRRSSHHSSEQPKIRIHQAITATSAIHYDERPTSCEVKMKKRRSSEQFRQCQLVTIALFSEPAEHNNVVNTALQLKPPLLPALYDSSPFPTILASRPIRRPLNTGISAGTVVSRSSPLSLTRHITYPAQRANNCSRRREPTIPAVLWGSRVRVN